MYTGSVDDGGPMFIQAQSVTEERGPFSCILKVLREGHRLCVAHGRTIALGALHGTFLPLACYKDATFRGPARSDQLPSIA
jgi:hypothetical protein